MKNTKIMAGSKQADGKYKIVISTHGPYLVFGRPPLAQQFIMTNDKGESWYFQQGKEFSTQTEPTALCRCGATHRAPYCDGSHLKHQWNPEFKFPEAQLLDNAEIVKGGTLTMADNSRYCSFARFCDAGEGAWKAVADSDKAEARKLAIRESSLCPSARLTVWDNEADQPFEPPYKPCLGLIEDVTIGASGGLWVRGGIKIEDEQGNTAEIRNRVVLCRCGGSKNKPYCDGSHAKTKWHDNIEGVPEGETMPEKGSS